MLQEKPFSCNEIIAAKEACLTQVNKHQDVWENYDRWSTGFFFAICKKLQNPPPLGGEECVEELRNYVRFWKLLKTRKQLRVKSLYHNFSGVWSNWKSWIQNEGLHTQYGESRCWRNKSCIRKAQQGETTNTYICTLLAAVFVTRH